MSTNALPTQSTDFPAWYGEVVRRAELAESSQVRGAMVIKPHGYAIWEAIQRALDDRIKATGHENLYFPLLVPASVLAREAELVEGFAPELAIVTEAGGQAARGAAGGAADLGGDDLVDLRALGAVLPRPAAALQPVGERRPLGAPAPPVPAHERVPLAGGPHGARDRRRRRSPRRSTILHDVYADTVENVLAIPVLRGRKSESERFPGAVDTYTLEALMRDGKALQAATSHYLGQGFARTYDVRFTGRDGCAAPPLRHLVGRHHAARRRARDGARRRPRAAPAAADRAPAGGDRADLPRAGRGRGARRRRRRSRDELRANGVRVRARRPRRAPAGLQVPRVGAEGRAPCGSRSVAAISPRARSPSHAATRARSGRSRSGASAPRSRGSCATCRRRSSAPRSRTASGARSATPRATPR